MKRKTPGGLFFSIELRPYRYGLVVSIGQTDAEIRADMIRLDRRHKTGRVTDVIEAMKGRWPGFVRTWEADSFMFIREMPVTVQGQGVVVHELLHVVRHCMRTRNMGMGGMNGQEAYCYLLEETWNQVMGRVAEHLRKHDGRASKSGRR